VVQWDKGSTAGYWEYGPPGPPTTTDNSTPWNPADGNWTWTPGVYEPALPLPTQPSLEEAGRRLNAAQLKRLRAAQETINDLLKWADYGDREPEPEEIEQAEAAFTESASGHVLSLSEQLPLPNTQPIVPLHLDVALINPGWGNPHDNHYYPEDILRRDATIFEGVKMYETDHRQNEKSTRTWVSTVKEIKGFTSDGAPIGLVSIHDKNFAERLVALAADDLLTKMECSILANGTAKKGKVGDREGRIVEAITSADSVDWVTRAGAGGRALALSESHEQEEPMKPEEEPTDIEEQEQQPESEQTTFSEQEDPEEAPAPEALATERVKEMMAATKLPDASKTRLAEQDYQDEDALQEAIDAEIAYIKEITGGGKPFAQRGGTTPTQPVTPEAREEQSKARFNRIMREVGLEEVK
jgi:hypothetical protein